MTHGRRITALTLTFLYLFAWSGIIFPDASDVEQWLLLTGLGGLFLATTWMMPARVRKTWPEWYGKSYDGKRIGATLAGLFISWFVMIFTVFAIIIAPMEGIYNGLFSFALRLAMWVFILVVLVLLLCLPLVWAVVRAQGSDVPPTESAVPAPASFPRATPSPEDTP